MKIEHRIIVNVALVFIAAYGVCGCKSGRDLAYDGTFRYVCTSQVGPIAGGRTIHIERGCVRSVLIQVAQSMGLKLACDAECFYLYKKKLEIQSLERSLLLIPDGGPGQGQ